MNGDAVATGPTWLASPGALAVAMVVYGGITLDSRVQREAGSLVAAGHAVTIFCLRSDSEGMPMLDPRVKVVVVTPTGSAVVPESDSPFHRNPAGSRVRARWERLRWLTDYGRTLRDWGRAVTATDGDFHVWHAHDFAGLVAVAGRIPARAGLVYDVHDLFTETGTGARLPAPLRAMLRLYERRLADRAQIVIAVNDGIADYVRRRLGARSVAVVHNCVPTWTPPSHRPDLLRDAAGVPADAPVILYHGLLAANRGLDRLCEAVLEPGLERAHVVLLGFGQGREALSKIAAAPRFGGRVHLLDAVSPAELIPWVASADVGAMPMPKSTLNIYLSTPNKLFECLAAGVPVVVSDFPGMRHVVMDDPLGPLGDVCDPTSVADIARALRAILDLEEDEARLLRDRCLAAAHERWSWESEAEVLLAAYRGLRLSIPATGSRRPAVRDLEDDVAVERHR